MMQQRYAHLVSQTYEYRPCAWVATFFGWTTDEAEVESRP